MPATDMSSVSDSVGQNDTGKIQEKVYQENLTKTITEFKVKAIQRMKGDILYGQKY